MDNIKFWKSAPKCTVARTTNQTGLATGSFTTLDYSLQASGPRELIGDCWSGSTFTAPVEGLYRFSACAEVISLGNAKAAELWLYSSGGTQLRQMGQAINGTGGTASVIVTGHCYYYAERGDAFVFKLWHNHGSNRDITGTIIKCYATIDYITEPA
jgi:hypothetical protein